MVADSAVVVQEVGRIGLAVKEVDRIGLAEGGVDRIGLAEGGVDRIGLAEGGVDRAILDLLYWLSILNCRRLSILNLLRRLHLWVQYRSSLNDRCILWVHSKIIAFK